MVTKERPRRLSAALVSTVTDPGRYGDGRGGFGLSLLVKGTTNGLLSKSWAQRLRIDGETRSIGLGSYPGVTLSLARKRALANLRTVEDGGDPRRKPQSTPTFADAMERAIEVLRQGWRNAKTEQTQRRAMSEILSSIGRRPVDSITPAEVLATLEPLAAKKPALAKKARTMLSQTFKWAIAQGLRTDNPAGGSISPALPKLSTKEHFKALPFKEVGAAIQTVRSSSAWEGTKLAFEFLVLTATRSGEVRLARWNEVDFEAMSWTAPAEHTKASRVHRVPLSDAALAVLDKARQMADGSGLVFPSITGKSLSDSTISKLVRELGIQAHPHGFRSSFTDWCAERNIPLQVSEAALGHSVGNATVAAYLRSDMFEARRPVMQAWANYVLPK